MTDPYMRWLNRELTKDKFKDGTELTSRYMPKYPFGSERELDRLMKRYMKIVEVETKRRLPSVIRRYKQAQKEELTRMDDVSDVIYFLKQTFFEIATAIEQRIENLHWFDRLLKIGNYTRDYVNAEWNRVVHNTLGLDLSEDYYNGEFYSEELNAWLSESVSRIQSIPSEFLEDLQQTLFDDFTNGMTIDDIANDIQERFGVSERKAELLARDQIGTLNSKLTERQHEDAGVTKYIWEDSADERVRPCHRELNGHVFEYKNPPEMWYLTKSRGKVMTGRHCNPGADYNCRCTATPVFDWEQLELPIQAR